MGQSVLLQLARDSISEVLQAQKIIDKDLLLKSYPLLHKQIATEIKIYLSNELRGRYKTETSLSLIEAITVGAKRAAFQSKEFPPLQLSQYLRCEIELILTTDEGNISERDTPLIS